jgi:hypothetical protein
VKATLNKGSARSVSVEGGGGRRVGDSESLKVAFTNNQAVQLGTAGELPTQLFARFALIGEPVVVMTPFWR